MRFSGATRFHLFRFSQVAATAALILSTGCYSKGDKEPLLSEERDLEQEKLDQPFAKAFADLNGDGFLDILIGDYGDRIYAYKHPAWDRYVLSESNGGDDIRSADIDGDGFEDILSNGSRISWYGNPGKEEGAETADWVMDRPWQEHVIRPGMRSHDLVIGEIDGDDKMDVGARVENGVTMIFLQKDPDSWTAIPLDQALPGVGMELADMDGDGRLDVLGSGYWLRQPEDPEGQTWQRVDVAPDWPAASSVQAGDINGDERMDLIVAGAYSNHRLSWFEGKAEAGDWTEHIVAEVSHVHRFHLADVDGDGAKDIVFAEQHQSHRHRVGAMMNMDGSGGAWEMRVFSNQGGHNIAVADIDGDDKLEVLAVNWSGDTRVRLLSDLLLESRKAPFPGLLSRADHPPGRSAP